MFERYTERARRVLFFARYEASQLGSLSIQTEHLLLGLIREGKGVAGRILARAHVSLEDLRKDIEASVIFQEKIATSVEIPFSADTKRVLQFAAEEADRLLHDYIGTEHLLLGILREEHSAAAILLMQHGLRLDEVRQQIVQLLGEGERTRDGTSFAEVRQRIVQLLGEGARSRPPCCFCGQTLPSSEATVGLVVVHARGADVDARQYLYAHLDCLRSRLSPNVPLIAEDERDDVGDDDDDAPV